MPRLLLLELVLRLLVEVPRVLELEDVVALPLRLVLLLRVLVVAAERLLEPLSLSLVLEERLEELLAEERLLELLSLSLVAEERLDEVLVRLLSELTVLRLLLSLVELLRLPLLFELSELMPLRLVLLPRPLLSVLTPLRLLLLPLSRVEEERLLLLLPRPLLSVLMPLRLLLLPRSDTSPVRLGAGVVLRLPVARSVTVMVLSVRLLVMRLPLRCVGSFCTVACEREVVILPTRGSLV